MKGGKRANSGRKKQAPTTILNFRISVDLKMKLINVYGRNLNKIIIELLINKLNEDTPF